jgi:hypothetical protein
MEMGIKNGDQREHGLCFCSEGMHHSFLLAHFQALKFEIRLIGHICIR